MRRYDHGGPSLDCRPNFAFMTAFTMKADNLTRRPEWEPPAARPAGDCRSVCDAGVGDCGRRRHRARPAELTTA